MGLLFFVGFLCNTLGYLFARLRLSHLVNIPPSVYDPFAILIISMIYSRYGKSRYRYAFFAIAAVYILIACVNFFFIQKQTITSYAKLLGSLIVIGYCVFYFYQLIVTDSVKHLQKRMMFWLSAAFLIYHSGALVLFAFTSYLINKFPNDMIMFMSFHNLLSVVSQLIIIAGMVMNSLRAPASADIRSLRP